MIVRVNRLATPHSEADVSANGWTVPPPTNPPEAGPAGGVRLRCTRPAGGGGGMSGLLGGIRVLDLTNVLAGPFACYQLAVLGAEAMAAQGWA